MAPQVSHGGPSYMSDVYSFGCVLFCMSTGRQDPLSHDPLDLELLGLGPLSCLKEDPLGPHPGPPGKPSPCVAEDTQQGPNPAPPGKWHGPSPCMAEDPLDLSHEGLGQPAQQPGACGSGRVMSAPRWPHDTYPLLRQLGESCLVRDPAQRPSFSNLMQVGV